MSDALKRTVNLINMKSGNIFPVTEIIFMDGEKDQSTEYIKEKLAMRDEDNRRMFMLANEIKKIPPHIRRDDIVAHPVYNEEQWGLPYSKTAAGKAEKAENVKIATGKAKATQKATQKAAAK